MNKSVLLGGGVAAILLGLIIGDLLGFVLLAAGVAAVVLGVIAARNQARSAQRGQTIAHANSQINPDTGRPDPRSLKPGDVINLDGSDYTVDASIDFDQGGWSWQEHQLVAVDGSTSHWLSVEDDDSLELALWQRKSAPDLEPSSSVVFEGITYTLDERGRARYAKRVRSGSGESGEVEYADFEADNDQLLAFERYGQGASWEVSTGRKLRESDLDIYPGSEA